MTLLNTYKGKCTGIDTFDAVPLVLFGTKKLHKAHVLSDPEANFGGCQVIASLVLGPLKGMG